MTGEVVSFPLPGVFHFDRVCNQCGAPWTVDCIAGATPPARDPYYRCPDCRRSLSTSTAGLHQIVDRERQLHLVPSPVEEAASDG